VLGLHLTAAIINLLCSPKYCQCCQCCLCMQLPGLSELRLGCLHTGRYLLLK
jgi:hypothetical protein